MDFGHLAVDNEKASKVNAVVFVSFFDLLSLPSTPPRPCPCVPLTAIAAKGQNTPLSSLGGGQGT